MFDNGPLNWFYLIAVSGSVAMLDCEAKEQTQKDRRDFSVFLPN